MRAVPARLVGARFVPVQLHRHIPSSPGVPAPRGQPLSGHRTRVADPYRWLEQDVRKSKEVADWVAAQNKVTQAYLAAIPERDAIRRRLTELWNYERFSVPFKRGGRYFYTRNDGLQNQAVL